MYLCACVRVYVCTCLCVFATMYWWNKMNNMTPTSWKRCSRLQQSRCPAVTEDWMISFAAYSAAGTPWLFYGPDLPKLSPIKKLIPWTHKSELPKPHLDRLCRFCTARQSDQDTDRQTTLHATSSIRYWLCRLCIRGSTMAIFCWSGFLHISRDIWRLFSTLRLVWCIDCVVTITSQTLLQHCIGCVCQNVSISRWRTWRIACFTASLHRT